jgi:adenylyltransferase/sulfurtransferase
MPTSHPTLHVDLADADGRYHRQELISWWDQQRLANARVLVVGAGALGNELVKNLALLGVGTIAVIDLDRVENSNLSRGVLFRERDEGRAKATVVAQAAAELNPEVRVIPIVGDVRLALGLGFFREFDLVLGGLDNREARLHVNQACWKTSTPWIDGAIEGLMGVVRVFVPPDSACYECTMNRQDFRLLANRRACSLLTREEMLGGKVPTTVTSASVIAALQAQEAVKLLHRDRLAYDFVGKGFVFNGLTHDSYVVSYPRRSNCLSHDTYQDSDWTSVPADHTFGQVLELAQHELGSPAVLDLEHDVVVSMTCRGCDLSESVLAPVEALSAGAALCPDCGAERALNLTHSLTPDDQLLLSLTPEQLGLPPFDVVAARAGQNRRFYRLGLGAPLQELNDAT